jgi:hypothetical protein
MTLPLTYSDLQREGVFSSRLLTARLHFASRASHPHLIPLSDVVTRLGGDWFVGGEPGTTALTLDSPYAFLRTGATSTFRASIRSIDDGGEAIHQFGYRAQHLASDDILIAKDGPVGQVAVLRWHDARSPMISSGLVRLRLPGKSWFYFALLRYGPFTSDIEVLTPGGATYRHAGLPLLLSARLPDPDHQPDLQMRLGLLARIVSDAEVQLDRRYRSGVQVLDQWAGTVGIDVRAPVASSRSVEHYVAAGRFDSTFHGAMSSPFAALVSRHSRTTLEGMVADGHVRRNRGQNLQLTAIGFSEKHDDFRPGSYRLIEPNFIGRDMSLPKSRWLWCPRPLATLTPGTVVMSSEGTVGNLAVLPPSVDREPTISNIHATILDWTGGDRDAHNAWLAFNLIYLREKGWLDAVSAGGQGGSLGFNYHGFVPLFDFDTGMAATLGDLISANSDAPGPAELVAMSPTELELVATSTTTQGIWGLDVVRGAAELALRQLIQTALPELFG